MDQPNAAPPVDIGSMFTRDLAEEIRLEGQRAAAQKQAVDSVAERLLGIGPDVGNAVYTAHPVMAGVIRQALGEAFDGGVRTIATALLQEHFGRAPATKAESPPSETTAP